MEKYISDLDVVLKLLEYSSGSVEALEVDKAMNAIITAQEYLKYLQSKMNETLSAKRGTYYTEISEDGLIEIPIEILEELGWDEGTEVTIEADTQNNTIIIRKIDTSDFPGCGGDQLTEEEEDTLARERLRGLFQMKSPWEE